jgi:hypothetical protein
MFQIKKTCPIKKLKRNIFFLKSYFIKLKTKNLKQTNKHKKNNIMYVAKN